MTKLNDLKFKDYAVSHLGALHGCLEYLGIEVTQAWLYGITSHGLMINTASGDICPSGPTAWKEEPVYFGAKNLGVELDGVMAWPKQGSEAEYETKLKEAYELVVSAIAKGQPCYGWQIGDIADYYIIYGVDDTGYYFKGYFQEEGAGPKPWKDIGKMFIDIMSVRRVKAPVDEKIQVKDALKWTSRIAANDKEWIQTPRYQAGLAGFDNWIEAVEKGTAVQFGNAYNAMVWWECRDMAHKFFLEAKERLNGKTRPFFEKAGELYREVAEQLYAFAQLYPFDKDKLTMDKITVDDTSREAVQHLKKAREAEAKGLKVIETLVGIL